MTILILPSNLANPQPRTQTSVDLQVQRRAIGRRAVGMQTWCGGTNKTQNWCEHGSGKYLDLWSCQWLPCSFGCSFIVLTFGMDQKLIIRLVRHRSARNDIEAELSF